MNEDLYLSILSFSIPFFPPLLSSAAAAAALYIVLLMCTMRAYSWLGLLKSYHVILAEVVKVIMKMVR